MGKEFNNVKELMYDIENDDGFSLFSFLEDSAVKHDCRYSLPQGMEDDIENLILEQQAEIERLREALNMVVDNAHEFEQPNYGTSYYTIKPEIFRKAKQALVAGEGEC